LCHGNRAEHHIVYNEIKVDDKAKMSSVAMTSEAVTMKTIDREFVTSAKKFVKIRDR